jgi:hypothetical protein
MLDPLPTSTVAADRIEEESAVESSTAILKIRLG